MRNLRLFAGVVAALGASALGASALGGCGDSGSDAELHVQNNSDFAIVEIHLTSVGSPTWGPNLLINNDILAPGDALVLGVNCDTYDALLVDEQGVDCEIHDIDLCLNHADWIINNSTCSVFGAAKAAREAAQNQAAGQGQVTPTR